MGYSVEPLADKPVVLIRYSEPYDPAEDAAASAKAIGPAIGQVMARGPEKGYMVFDLSNIEISFGGSVQALGELFRSENGMNTLGDGLPPIEVFLVGTDDLVAFAAEAVTQEQYGANEMPQVFGSLDEVLDHIEA